MAILPTYVPTHGRPAGEIRGMTATVTDSVVPTPPYRNAPIIEAVIDIQVDFSSPDALETLRAFSDALALEFPRKEPTLQIDMLVEGKPDGESIHTSNTRLIGWKLFNSSNDRVLLLQRPGFTYSHMAPYTEWDVFSREFFPLWDRFVEVCRPSRVSRLAVRNINRLKLPVGEVDLSDYLPFSPDVPPAIGVVNHVVMRVQTPQPSIGDGGHAIVTLATEDSGATDYQPVILDVDVFQAGSWQPEDPVILEQLKAIRKRKNEIFEACISDEMRRLFA